jgi:NADH:ubiquinone oxidoreductase subunit C
MPQEKIDKSLKTAEDMLKTLAVSTSHPETFRLDIILKRENLMKAVETLVEARWGYLSAITGLDLPYDPLIHLGEGGEELAEEEDHLRVLYHFCEGAAITTLRVTIPYSDASLPTICNLIPTATLYERELMEMFGVVVENTPNPDHLLLTDDWPQGVYPLRKSFTGLQKE